MGCGCKNKNQTQPAAPQPQSPQPAAPQNVSKSQTVQNVIKKTIEKYYQK